AAAPPRRDGLAALHRADAGRCAGGHGGDRQRPQRRAARRPGARRLRPRAAAADGGVPGDPRPGGRRTWSGGAAGGTAGQAQDRLLSVAPRPGPGSTGRLVGIDVARCLALLGMVATHLLLPRTPEGELAFAHSLAGGRASAL